MKRKFFKKVKEKPSVYKRLVCIGREFVLVEEIRGRGKKKEEEEKSGKKK